MVYNPDWATGMGSSIRIGVKEILTKQADLEAILLLLVDQPLIQVSQLQTMLNLHQKNPTAIIAAAYKSTLGVPALFPKYFFPSLIDLKEQVGAKKIIKKFQDQVIPFSCPEAAFDIDTEADYKHLLRH
jgi:molybdenum cofactor cytidylyltransferase